MAQQASNRCREDRAWSLFSVGLGCGLGWSRPTRGSFGDRAVEVSASGHVGDHCFFEISVGEFLEPEALSILGGRDEFESHSDSFEELGKPVTGDLDVMQPSTVGKKQRTVGNCLEKICYSPSQGHRSSLRIEAICSHHSPLRQDDDHRIGPHRISELIPRLVPSTGNRHDFRCEQLEKTPCKRSFGRLVGERNETVLGHPSEQSVWDSAQEERFEEAGVVEQRDEVNIVPPVRTRVSDPSYLMPIEDTAQVLDSEEKYVTESFFHSRAILTFMISQR